MYYYLIELFFPIINSINYFLLFWTKCPECQYKSISGRNQMNYCPGKFAKKLLPAKFRKPSFVRIQFQKVVKSSLNILKVYCDEKIYRSQRLSKCLRLTCVRESDIFTLLCGRKKGWLYTYKCLFVCICHRHVYICLMTIKLLLLLLKKKKSMVPIMYGLQKHILKIRDYKILKTAYVFDNKHITSISCV